MSNRDLWLHEDLIEAEDPRFDYFVYDGTIYDKPHPYLIHYRKVNPALDKAIEGLVEALEWYEKNSTDQQCCNNGVQVGEQEWACCNQPITMAGISLAAYKAAKEGEK